mgnify:CR=1 FL=1
MYLCLTRAILGTLWDMFEASTEGMGEAAAIRIAHHLGELMITPHLLQLIS